MIKKIALYRSAGYDPHFNLAVEQYLMESVQDDQCILYLWQNQNTVVIGRNQNPWKECRTTLLSEEGGHLARRLSGGGAVFHDLGNLNFTFLMPQADYSLDRQFAVIQQAVNSLGIPAERSGRNDILSQGRKFSGNAFYKNGRQAYHHGTLLVDVDMEKLGRYLNPSKAKLQSKGVDSVRSRVVNLKQLKQELTIEELCNALQKAFASVYGAEPEILTDADLDLPAIEKLAERNRSWEWNYGQKLPFSLEREERFPWGGLQLQLQVENGIIQALKAYSDAMDWALPEALEQALTGCRLEKQALLARLREVCPEEAEEICRMITE